MVVVMMAALAISGSVGELEEATDMVDVEWAASALVAVNTAILEVSTSTKKMAH